MLPKEFKLKNSEEIKATMKQGSRQRGRYVSVFFRPNSEKSFRAATVISRKVATSAVARNRVRRVIFAKLSNDLGALGEKANGDMVVLVQAVPEDEKLLITELEKCLKDLSLT